MLSVKKPGYGGYMNIENLADKLRSMRDKLAEVGDSSDDDYDDDSNVQEVNEESRQVQNSELSFVIDRKPGGRSSPLHRRKSKEISEPKLSSSNERIEPTSSHKTTKAIPVLDPGIDLEDTYLPSKVEPHPKLPKLSAKELAALFCKEDKLLANSVIKPGFLKQDTIPPYRVSEKKLKKERRMERSKTKGEKWFNMPATELTEERKNDLAILQMRSALDPKRFYKKNDLSVLPKYFQIGTVVDSPADFYHARVPKKQRKRTIVEELLADAEFRKYNKRKFNSIQHANSRVRKPFQSKERKKQD